jgi:hypothetical protein
MEVFQARGTLHYLKKELSITNKELITIKVPKPIYLHWDYSPDTDQYFHWTSMGKLILGGDNSDQGLCQGMAECAHA